MKKKADRYGKGFQYTVLGGLVAFCLKTNHIKTKVGLGFLYMYWGSHFYALGTHLGLLVNTPCKYFINIVVVLNHIKGLWHSSIWDLNLKLDD